VTGSNDREVAVLTRYLGPILVVLSVANLSAAAMISVNAVIAMTTERWNDGAILSLMLNAP
jgi:hypothetical protein